MSEYQYYEFVALDRPLTSIERAELRRVSSRAEITSTRFRNEYHWGDLKADPVALLARYFDLHVYVANWGARRLMFRIPVAAVDLATLREYFPGDAATLTLAGEHTIVDIRREIDGPDDDWAGDAAVTAALAPLRSQLIRGDRRLAYLAWLLAVQADEVDPTATEPRVPSNPGLAADSAPIQALVRFLRIDPDLLAAAQEGGETEDDREAERFGAWVERLPSRQRDQWLQRAAAYPELALGAEMLSEFRRTHRPAWGTRRTVGELLSRAQQLAATHRGHQGPVTRSPVSRQASRPDLIRDI